MTTLGSYLKRLSASQRGILWMLLTMLLFATTNVIAKYLAEVYAIPQVVWARFTFYALFLVLLFRRRLPAALATKRLLSTAEKKGTTVAEQEEKRRV